jgi:hypothetical protein
MRIYQSVEEKLHKAQFAIENAIADPTVASAIAEYGYDDARMAEGKSLCDRATELHQKQFAEYGDKYEATDELHKAWREADEAYRTTFRIARIALREKKKAWSSMRLYNANKRSLLNWLSEVNTFYSNLLNDLELILEMERFAYTRERLLAEQALVDSVAEAKRMRDTEQGEAQYATMERDQVLAELGQWFDDFMEIVDIALAKTPQQMEKLGVVVH